MVFPGSIVMPWTTTDVFNVIHMTHLEYSPTLTAFTEIFRSLSQQWCQLGGGGAGAPSPQDFQNDIFFLNFIGFIDSMFNMYTHITPCST